MAEQEGVVAPEATGADAPAVTNAVEPATTETQDSNANPQKGNQGVPDAVRQRLAALSRNESRWRREAAESKARAEMLERQYQQPQQQPHNQSQQRQPEPQFDPQQIFAQAKQAAAFDARCNAVAEKGKAVPGFSEALTNLGMIGLDQGGLEVLIDADDAPKLIAHLGSHLDEAAEIFAKPPAAMARALAKLEATLGAAPAVSAAPNPLNPVRAAASKSEPQPGTKEWAMKRNEERIKKYGRP